MQSFYNSLFPTSNFQEAVARKRKAKKKDKVMSQAHRSQFEEAPRSYIWENLGTKIIKHGKEI